jgi:hypothetical protein
MQSVAPKVGPKNVVAGWYTIPMASWNEIESALPDFAARVRTCFEAGTNKTLATLRADGSPRISASECKFAGGELTLGMMGDSRKLHDVRRDPRVALHSPTIEPPPAAAAVVAGAGAGADPWLGDAKMAGRLAEIDPPVDNAFPGAGYFRLDVSEVALTYLGDPPDHLVIESWHPREGWRRRTRT